MAGIKLNREWEDFRNVCKTTLFIGSLDTVYRACQECATKWRPFGLRLGLSESVLEETEIVERGVPSNCLHRVLAEWLKRNYSIKRFNSELYLTTYPEPSWWALCIAIVEGAHNPQVAFEIAVEHKATFVEVSQPCKSEEAHAYYTDKDFKDMCVCGNCSFQQVITEGCNERKERFHQLDIKRLTPEHQELYQSKLLKATEEIKQQFSELFIDIAMSMRNVPVKMLKMFLNTIGWFETISEDKMNPLQEELDECRDSESVFVVLSKTCSWFNHHTLGRVTNKFGSEDDKGQYHHYVNVTLQQFLERNITKFTIYGSGNNEISHKFHLKMETYPPHSYIRGTILPYLKGSVADCLEIPIENLHIISFKEGCLEVVFSLPVGIYNKLFPLSLHRSRKLETLVVRESDVELTFKSMYYAKYDPDKKAEPVQYTNYPKDDDDQDDAPAVRITDNSMNIEEVILNEAQVFQHTTQHTVQKPREFKVLLIGTLSQSNTSSQIQTVELTIENIAITVCLHNTNSPSNEVQIASLTKAMHGDEADIVFVCNDAQCEPEDRSNHLLKQAFGPDIWEKCIFVWTQKSTCKDKNYLLAKLKQEVLFKKYQGKKGLSENLASDRPIIANRDAKTAKMPKAAQSRLQTWPSHWEREKGSTGDAEIKKAAKNQKETHLSQLASKSRVYIQKYGLATDEVIHRIINEVIIPLFGNPLEIKINNFFWQHNEESRIKND